MRLEVDPQGYHDAAQPLSSASAFVTDTAGDLIAALVSSGAMAGDDSGGQQFASQYDTAADRTVAAGANLGRALATMSGLVRTAAHNHASADAGSDRSGASALPPPPQLQERQTTTFDVPSAAGGTGDEPDWWHYVLDHIGGLVWPDADTGKLRRVGSAWLTAANGFAAISGELNEAVALLRVHDSPEVPQAVSAVHLLDQCATQLASRCRSLGNACHDYADQVADAHERSTHIMEGLLAGLAITAVLGIGLTLVTFGGSDVAAAAAASAEVAAGAEEVAGVLETCALAAEEGAGIAGDVAVGAGEIEVDLAPFEAAEPELAEISQAAEATEAGGEGIAGESAEELSGDLDTIEQHLTRLDHSPANDAMTSRIRDALESGRPLTEAEQNFMTHELTEAELMDGGMGYEEAHEIAMQTHPTFANYDPEVISQFPELFNNNWFNFWGLK